nr:hypothetical protein [uncultured Sulfurimonas sp.]
MFISSYNTYINTNSSQKTENQKTEKPKSLGESFESKLAQNLVLESKNTQNLPITYISNYKAFSNKQKLDEEFQNKDATKYTKINSMKNAKNAYETNSKMFSLFLEPKATQSQTPSINQNLSSELQQAQEKNLRHTMVNTYLENDKYYQITA